MSSRPTSPVSWASHPLLSDSNKFVPAIELPCCYFFKKFGAIFCGSLSVSLRKAPDNGDETHISLTCEEPTCAFPLAISIPSLPSSLSSLAPWPSLAHPAHHTPGPLHWSLAVFRKTSLEQISCHSSLRHLICSPASLPIQLSKAPISWALH